MRYGNLPSLALALAVVGASSAAASPAWAADKARITGLSDVTFGVIAGTGDQSVSQSLCAFSDSSSNGYSVIATGNGSGGSFELSSGSAQLPYEVLWADSAGQTGGSALVAGVVTSGFTSGASHQFCNSGPSASASLTIVIRGATLSSARAGAYLGTLQITIAPE